MRPWDGLEIPSLNSKYVRAPIFLTNSRTGKLQPLTQIPLYRMYVCGITPYDATHLGHAATYLTFDLINRLLLASGSQVHYVQNITDIDDPLLERAKRDGLDWQDLALSQINLFKSDMESLRVIPPQSYIGAVEAIPLVIESILKLQDLDSLYTLGSDYYFMNSHDFDFGGLSHLDEATMRLIFAERGGDPTLAGKFNPLDCLVWMAQREGEPGWPSELGSGRPGWHIECTAIAIGYLEPDLSLDYLIDIQGGGSDLIFPHHEMCRSQARVLTGKELASNYVHSGMIGLDGEKMSKSKGNLVLVSKLVAQGVDPMAIRYALMHHHYRSDQMWSEELLTKAERSIERLQEVCTLPNVAGTQSVIDSILAALADDLDTPRTVEIIDNWVDRSLGGEVGGDILEFKICLDSLLGIKI